MRPLARALASGALALALAGCPDEPPKPPPDAGVVPLPAPADAAVTEVLRLEPVNPIPEVGCAGGPGWLGLAPCRRGGAVYAQAHVPVGINGSLARTSAAERARLAAAEAAGLVDAEGRVLLRGAEVPQVHRCDDALYALARLPAEAPALPECTDAVDEPAVAPDGCPEWTRGVAWRADGAWVGVAQVDGIKSPSLARTSAQGRARNAVAAALESTLIRREAAVRALVTQRSLPVSGAEVAQCAGSVWAKVTVREE
jgi:hypothetical protein